MIIICLIIKIRKNQINLTYFGNVLSYTLEIFSLYTSIEGGMEQDKIKLISGLGGYLFGRLLNGFSSKVRRDISLFDKCKIIIPVETSRKTLESSVINN